MHMINPKNTKQTEQSFKNKIKKITHLSPQNVITEIFSTHAI